MASVENTKEHMHDVVGTPCCHGGWPAMEEVARAEPFLSLLMLVLSEWTIIMLDCAVAFCSLCLQMPSLQLGMSCPLALCYVKSECLCVRVFVFPHWFNFIKGFLIFLFGMAYVCPEAVRDHGFLLHVRGKWGASEGHERNMSVTWG